MLKHYKMKKENLLKLQYNDKEIQERRKKIYKQALRESRNLDQGNFKMIGRDDLAKLFTLYDKSFFNRFFYQNNKEKISFHLSKRMTKSAGKIEYYKQTGSYKISLSTFLIFQTFRDVNREVEVNGIQCRDRLEATMVVFEHEIIHLLERVVFNSTSCSKPRYRRLSKNIFGHTDVTHRLVTQPERAYKKFNLQVGDKVTFEYKGKGYYGFISRITKRATVMVRDPTGGYMDTCGNHYSKYYVPLSDLKKVERKK